MIAKLTRRKLMKNTVIAGLVAPVSTVMGQTNKALLESAKGPPVFLNYTQAQLDAAYNQRVWAPNRDRIRVRRMVRKREALSRLGEPERIAYGPSMIEQLDLYKTNQSKAPIHIAIHGGAWRAGGGFGHSASQAEVFVRSGAHFIAPDFVLVQDAGGSLFPMVEQIRQLVAWVYNNAASFDGDSERIYISGHSSGGHLVSTVLLTDWPGNFNLPENILKGALCSSGIFDLHPVSLSSRREYVAFTDVMVEELSTIRHLDKINTPIIVTYGTAESPEFQRQSREFYNALVNEGKQVQLLVGEGYNHYEIIDTMGNPFGFLGHAALKQMELSWN
jgi:arylformamidase